MSNYDAESFENLPSPAWEPIQKHLNALNRSIKIWESESVQTVVKPERHVKRYGFETSQQVSSVTKPEMNRSASQVTFVGAGPSKTFISSNTIGSAVTSGSEPKTTLSSQSPDCIADSTAAYIASLRQLSQKMKLLTEESAMVPFNPRKRFNRTETVSTNGKMKSNELVYWPPESYTETTHVPVLSNKDFIFHNDSQQYENINREKPEQLTSVAQSSIMLHAREINSPPQAMHYETVISDEQQATDNGNSKSNEIVTSKHSPSEVGILKGASGRKHSPSPAGKGSRMASNELIHTPNDKYVMSNKPLQQNTTLALDTPTTSRQPILSYPIKARKYMSTGQSQMITAAVDHSYTNLTKGPESVTSQQSARQVVPSEVAPKESDYVPKAPIMAHTLADSNNDVIKSNEMVKLSTTSRVASTYVPALLKNDLPQATNKEMLKSDVVPLTPTTFEEKSAMKSSPSHTVSRNSSIESNANAIIQSPTTSEFNAPPTSQPIYSYPLTAQSYSLEELSNIPIILDQDDTGLQYQGVEYEVLADQPHYQAIPTVIESTILGTEPVKTYTPMANNNKVVIESNVLIEPPNASLVKSTYAQALPKNPRKNSNQVMRKPVTSKAGPMVASNRLNLQSKLPLKSVAGANSTWTTQSNVEMKSNASMKRPAVKSQLKLPPGQITAQSATQLSDFDRKSRIMKPVQQEHRPHQGPRSLPQQAKKLESTSVPLKRKQKENISPVVFKKPKPLLQEPNQVKITTLDESFTLPEISIERVDIVGGIKKKVPVIGMKLQASSELKSNAMTLTDCMQTLLRNNVQLFKVPLPVENVLARYIKTLEKNNVRVTKLKKK